ncbi:unnamed protein product [Spirodela intermedia]|uniref:Phytocyanin domain-containing protein n=1 Tax=Spirodela intermedia TaxID=51605 RepID=A0A7I8IUM4_SPIIN|nr:unnamed protein product [Spirodela intermedia]CAA6661675.1 unnamed protein product [Spirodela intermedia]
MPQMPSPVLSLLIISSFFAAAQLGRATDHIVGARLGWNPNINYSNWANNQTFYVNDFISFRYQKHTYNVFEVNETGYDNCTTEGAAGNWSSGKDFILLDEAKRYYFICGTGFCYSGMKVSVVVHPLRRRPLSPPLMSQTRRPPVQVGRTSFGADSPEFWL